MNVQAKPQRIFNFSAGPAMLPLEVLEATAQALVNYQGKGVGIAEVSHRGKEFEAVLDEATTRCKTLLGLADSHDILFLQGGATQLFTTIPMNAATGPVDYLVGGEWSQKAAKAAQASGAQVSIVASSEASGFDRSPEPQQWKLNPEAAYLHVCSNETVHGHRLPQWPSHPRLIVDASSEFMSRPHPVNDCALVYAGAQKNLGPAGVVLVLVRKDLYPRIPKSVPALFNFQKQAEGKSMLNTPPTLGIYMLLETFRWLERQGGLAAMERRNEQKAGLIYDAIDTSQGFYTGTVAVREQRSRMNVTFRLQRDELTDVFIKEASQLGMTALKGYRTVGGIRASIYNALPIEGCQALAAHMTAFAAKNR